MDCKHRILVQLRDVGYRQMELVTIRDTAALIKLLAAKQSLIAALQAVERELAPYSVEEPSRRVWATQEERGRCAQQAAECNSLLREIVELDKQGVDRMTAHRDEIAAQLQQIHTAVDVRNAYRAQR